MQLVENLISFKKTVICFYCFNENIHYYETEYELPFAVSKN